MADADGVNAYNFGTEGVCRVVGQRLVRGCSFRGEGIAEDTSPLFNGSVQVQYMTAPQLG